jgi:hypothetical protein
MVPGRNFKIFFLKILQENSIGFLQKYFPGVPGKNKLSRGIERDFCKIYMGVQEPGTGSTRAIEESRNPGKYRAGAGLLMLQDR